MFSTVWWVCSQQEEEEEVVFWKVRDMAHLLSLEAVVVGETAMLTNIPAAAASVASTSSSPRLSMVAAGACGDGYRKSIGPRQDRLRLGTSVVAAAAATSYFREQSNKALLVCQQQPQVRHHHNNNRVIPISSAAAVALPGMYQTGTGFTVLQVLSLLPSKDFRLFVSLLRVFVLLLKMGSGSSM